MVRGKQFETNSITSQHLNGNFHGRCTKNDESVKFFTAFPTLACHQLNRGTSDPPHACQ